MLSVTLLQESRTNIFSEVCFKPALGRIFCFLQDGAQGSTLLQVGHLKEGVPAGADTRGWLSMNSCWKRRNALIVQISLHFFSGSRRQGGALVRRCWRWDGAGKGREQKAVNWKQDRGYCTHGEYSWKAWPSLEGVSSRPEDGNPVPSAFSTFTTLPGVT